MSFFKRPDGSEDALRARLDGADIVAEAVARAGWPTAPSAQVIDLRERTLQGQLMVRTRDEQNADRDDTVDPVVSVSDDDEVTASDHDRRGFGPLAPYLDDPAVTEIMVSSTQPISIERAGRVYETEARFESDARLRQVIDRMAAAAGRSIDPAMPILETRLPDASRINAILPPVAMAGPTLNVRPARRERLRLEDLEALGTLDAGLSALLAACVRGRLNIVVSGEPGAGRTTLLNVLADLVPAGERMVTIEDPAELQLAYGGVIRLEGRPPVDGDTGAIDKRTLLRHALRLRPDRIVVSDCQGPEVLDLVQALDSGHDGSLSSVRASSPRDALRRLERLAAMPDGSPARSILREQIAGAVDLVVNLARMRDGSRRITHVAEVVAPGEDAVSVVDVFRFDFEAGIDADGRFAGRTRPTGIRPGLCARLETQGISLPELLFQRDE